MPGFLKIETPELLYKIEFVCSRSECFAYKTQLDGDCNILNGFFEGFKKNISFENYYNCLYNLSKKNVLNSL